MPELPLRDRMKEESEESVPICIRCAHYAYWDGHDTCVEDMKIIGVFPNVCRKFLKNECEKLLQFKINAYRKRQDEKEKQGGKAE